MKKINSILLFILLPSVVVFGQGMQFSLASDFSVLRSFKKQQQYWAVGQTVAGHFNFTRTDGAYIFFTYYTNGKFNNRLNADAKSTTTTPAQIAYTNTAKMTFRHFSLGWRHYLKNTSDAESGWGLYAYAGFGLMLGKVENTHSVLIDTADYVTPVLAGKGNFKRLTLDLGLGYEAPLGGDIYLYIEGRTLVPITDYPSNYIFINKYAPLTGSINLGFRIPL